MKQLLRSLFLITGLITFASSGYATPVEYVRICSLYGEGFYYVPGTDVCFNPTTGETRQQTEGGTWVSHIPANPGTWVPNPLMDCLLGRLVKVGTFTSSNFSVNSHGKYETTPSPLTIGTGEFIAKVMMNGGFNVTARSSFCLSFYDVSTGQYSLLGCQDTAPLRDQAATWSYSPLRSVPPASFTRPFKLVGNNGDEWGAPGQSFDGTLSCWVCVQHAWR